MNFDIIDPDEKPKGPKRKRKPRTLLHFLLTHIYIRSAILAIVAGIILTAVISFMRSQPGFYPAEGRIAYASGNVVYKPNLFVMDANTGASTQLTSDGAIQADWSPDGQKIVFSNGDYGLFIINADGSNPVHLVRGEWAGFPAWSPLNDKIAYAYYDDVFVVDVDGSNPTNLTENFGVVHGMSGLDWSPDGSKIVFSCRLQSDHGLCVMSADGSDAKELVMSPHYEAYSPTWSPDGTKIAFVSDRDTIGTIYWVNSDGTGMTRIINQSLQNYQNDPTWSPDGEQIAFTACGPTEMTCEIYRIYLDGTRLTRLTNNTTMDAHPQWVNNR